jgi:hypothetical protein
MCGKAHGICKGTASDARHHPPRIETVADKTIEQSYPFLDRQGVPLRIGSEYSKADVLRQQPAAVAGQKFMIR